MEDNNTLKINLKYMKSDSLPGCCGYCKDPVTNIYNDTSYKFRIYLKNIPIDILEEMVTKGWTRCGESIYLSIYDKTCCKLYQPRLNINNFQITKEQKKIMKRFRKYLSGEYEKNDSKLKGFLEKEVNNAKKIVIEDNFKNKIFQNVKEYINSDNFLKILKTYIKDGNEIQNYLNKIKETKIRRITNKKYNFNYSSDLIFIIKKLYTLNYNKNNVNQIVDKESIEKNLKKLVNDLYNNFIQNYKSNDENISFNEETGHINFQIKNQKEYQKFINEENLINNEKNNKLIVNKKENNKINNNNGNIKKEKYNFNYFPEIVPEPEIYLPLKHTYTIELSKNIILSPTEERFLLYKKYEETIHKDKFVNLRSHNNYWGNSILEKNKKIPLPQNLSELTPHPELYPEFYGTYNLIHRIDNKIVAVTIVDILPHMLISDYCYYDPDYSFLDLGIVTAIREIEYMKSFNKLIDSNFIYYSLAEMSQKCQKLRYKGTFKPTEIMDHYTGNYVNLTDEIKKIIEDNKCHSLVNNNEKGNCNVKHFSMFEIEDKYFNLMVNVLGEKIYIDDFFNLYLEGEDNIKNQLNVTIKRFLEIIDKDIYNKIEFIYSF